MNKIPPETKDFIKDSIGEDYVAILKGLGFSMSHYDSYKAYREAIKTVPVPEPLHGLDDPSTTLSAQERYELLHRIAAYSTKLCELAYDAGFEKGQEALEDSMRADLLMDMKTQQELEKT